MSNRLCYNKCRFDKTHPKYYDYGRYYPRFRVTPYLNTPSGYGWPSFKHSAFQPSYTTPYPQFQEGDNFAKHFSYEKPGSMIPMNNWRLARVLSGDESNFYPGACVTPAGNCIAKVSRWSCSELYGGTFVPYGHCGFF